MARTARQLENAIIEMDNKRRNARSQAARDNLREKANYLRGELLLQKAQEARQAEQAEAYGQMHEQHTRFVERHPETAAAARRMITHDIQKEQGFRDTRPRYEVVCVAHEALDCEICG